MSSISNVKHELKNIRLFLSRKTRSLSVFLQRSVMQPSDTAVLTRRPVNKQIKNGFHKIYESDQHLHLINRKL